VNDLDIMDGHTFNTYGHIAIISKVSVDKIEIIQQNTSKYNLEAFKIQYNNGL
jgi:surface antigen